MRPTSAAAGTFSCVVDTHPRFHLEALRWFASLTRLAGVDPTDLVVHAVSPSQTNVLKYLQAQGVAVREVQPFDPRSPHCNKISGALCLAPDKPRGLSVLTDSDIVVFEDPRQLQVPSDKIGMTPVHMANPPLEILTTVFAAAGLHLPRRTAIQLQPGEYTAAGNGNGGLYLVPGALLPDVARAWAHWAKWLLARSALLAAWAVHVDQVAMALALAAQGIETFDLDVRWNFPVHVAAIIPADPPSPAVIHYHQQVDSAGRLLATGVAAIDRRIEEANAALGDVWREEFPNATYPLREEHQVTTLLVLKASPDGDARDLRAGWLPGLVEPLAHRAARCLPNDFERELSSEEIAGGAHRELVGGLWDELGALQLDFMIRQGLRPEMTLLDLGCGCLRGGVRFIRYLARGNYFGVDANASLLRSAWEIELARAGLLGRLPRQNLLVNRDFEAWRFGVSFDMVLAQSVFTHLPKEWLGRCLVELARCVRPGGSFFVTFFHCPSEWPEGEPRDDAAHGGTTFWDHDPFHYRESDVTDAADPRTWQVGHLRDWGHPRGQWMVRFRRR